MVNEQPPQAPVSDPRFQRVFLHPRYWGHWLAIGFLFLLSALPRAVVESLARCSGDMALRMNKKRRDVASRNLELCFPALGEDDRHALLRGHFRMAAQSILDYGLLLWASPRRLERLVQVRGIEHYEQAVAGGRGVIFLAPHSLGLDFGGLLMSKRYPGVSLFNRAKDPLTDWLMFYSRSRFGGVLFQREHGLRPIIREIRQGKFFYYLPDEDLGTENSQFVPFFGVAKATLPTMGRLAKLSNAVVIPCFSYYRPEVSRYELVLLPALEDYPTGDPAEDALRMNQAVEALVRLRPEQYMWTLRLFRTRPPGEPWLYAGTGKGRKQRRRSQDV